MNEYEKSHKDACVNAYKQATEIIAKSLHKEDCRVKLEEWLTYKNSNIDYIINNYTKIKNIALKRLDKPKE